MIVHFFAGSHGRRAIAGADNTWLHNGTWVFGGSGWVNTPGLGSDVVANGGFATDTTGWTASNSNLASVAGGQSGNALQIENSGASQGHAYQPLAVANGGWYSQSFYEKNGLTTGIYRVGTTALGNEVHGGGGANNVNWTPYAITYRALATTIYTRFAVGNTTVSNTVLFDEISVKPLALNHLFVVRNGSVATARPTLTAGTQAGVVAKLDSITSPANGIFAYHDGTNAVMLKLVAGIYTQLISTAATYAANALIELRNPSGNTWQLFYNGSQRGTDQTVSDLSIVGNTLAGGFSTYSGNTLAELTTS